MKNSHYEKNEYTSEYSVFCHKIVKSMHSRFPKIDDYGHMDRVSAFRTHQRNGTMFTEKVLYCK